MNLNNLMAGGVSDIMKTAGRYYLSNKEGRSFLARMLPEIKKSADLRTRSEKVGLHVPSFLIASVASQCNLHCAGCYARSGGACSDADASTDRKARDLTAEEWADVFSEADNLGVSFILIAGGEPFTRRDVIEAASLQRSMIFPIFTNGTMMDAEYLVLLESSRNLLPIFSIEGDERETDARRGFGTYREIASSMEQCRERGILFGASITVTTQTRSEVTSHEFLSELRARGCGAVIFVEYVPTDGESDHLMLSADEVQDMLVDIEHARVRFDDMIILAFPGDEAAMGGCLASGRGFFHINPQGGAEPCPFSPFSKHTVRTDSLKTILSSQFFDGTRRIALQAGPHVGGCVLFEREEDVRALLTES